MVNFIKNNPQKSSIVINENGKETLNCRGNQLMPLASAAKTIIALEFANQVASKQINKTTKIAVKDINRYYIPFTDGGAHPAWLKSLKKTVNDSVTLLETAKGMIRFSSNANTEYLQDLLGMDKINANLKELKIKNHSPYYYFTAGALMTCLNPDNIEKDVWLSKLKNLNDAEYRKLCAQNHQKLKVDTNFIKQFNFKNLPIEIQKIWSNKIVASTTKEYAELLKKINSENYFKPEVQQVLQQIMEWPMEYASNKSNFLHLGQKGGSTSFVLTDAFYLTDLKGNKISCAFFFNDLSPSEQLLINKNFSNFESSIITNSKFRERLVKELN
ncbi:serine hydrolase [Pedobacter mendelii]|uniref:beta-lactamase n=2 Tax=Pedobacter mendelii TaxID=1908240 RepID=A0ABQ2BCJ5_9SPHI|nr:D-alanyl-D-alanine carboxypeptidase [Pedobacter mendelii]